MIKNFERFALALVTVLLIGVMAGIFIGMRANRSPVTLLPYERETTESASDTQNIHITNGKLNINSATVEELSKLPGIGETYARRIVEYRNEHGLFISISDLEKVSGIGKKRLESIAEYITTGG